MCQDIENLELMLPSSNVNLHYQQAGNGNHTFLLIHGLGSNSKAFKKNISPLANKSAVIAIDLPGYGESELGDFVPGIHNYAKVISEFVELKMLHNVTLVGHSMGGQIAIQLASEPPTTWLKKLVLLSPAGLEQFTNEDKKWFRAAVNEQLYLNLTDDQIKQNFDNNFFGGKLPEDAQFMLAERLELKKEVEQYRAYVSTIVKSINAMLNEPVYGKMIDIKVPIQVIYGRNDKLIPNKILHPKLNLEAILEKLKNDYPIITIELLDDAGHFVLWDRSEAVNTLILENSGNP
jgi:pimeloyl-ACP methyl ester carboxylesterase